MNFYCIIRLL